MSIYIVTSPDFVGECKISISKYTTGIDIEHANSRYYVNPKVTWRHDIAPQNIKKQKQDIYYMLQSVAECVSRSAERYEITYNGEKVRETLKKYAKSGLYEPEEDSGETTEEWVSPPRKPLVRTVTFRKPAVRKRAGLKRPSVETLASFTDETKWPVCPPAKFPPWQSKKAFKPSAAEPHVKRSKRDSVSKKSKNEKSSKKERPLNRHVSLSDRWATDAFM